MKRLIYIIFFLPMIAEAQRDKPHVGPYQFDSVKAKKITLDATAIVPDTPNYKLAAFNSAGKLVKFSYYPTLGGSGVSTFAALTDGNIATPSNLQFLQYQTSDSKWHNHTLSSGDIPDLSATYQTVANLSTTTSLGSSNTLYPSQLAVKTYVDNIAAAITPKDAVRVATTAAGTLSSSFENGDAVDGVTLATGNRILIKNQAAPAENGIYTVNASGAPTRATDFDAAGEIPVGAEAFVQSGTVNAGRKYTSSVAVTTLNTDPITFVQTGGSSGIAWGAITGTLSDQTDLNSALSGKQASDADLTTIAGLTATTDNFLVSVSSAWASRTPAQVKTTLALNNVENAAASSLYQPLDADLTYLAGFTPTANVKTILNAADYAAVKTALTINNVDNTSDATKNSATATLTNKNITKRTGTTTSSATPTIAAATVDLYTITAQTVDITSMTTNFTLPTNEGDELEIWITGTASRAITWGASFAASQIALPTTTSSTSTLHVKFIKQGSLMVLKSYY